MSSPLRAIQFELIGYLVFFIFVYLYLVFGVYGTVDEGDSILHYLISKYSWTHQRLFYDPWGKPLFTFISSPFAQLGFQGIQIFNVIHLLGILWCIYLIANHLNFKLPILPVILMASFPVTLVNIPGGLTEPMFAHVLCWAIYAALKGNTNLATLLISMLPLVRSEGLILLILMMLFLLIQKEWRQIPWLLTGHVLYGIFGAQYHDGDFFWTLSKIPYPVNEGVYGHGTWRHFFENLTLTFGNLGRFLIAFGVLLTLYLNGLKFSRDKKDQIWILLIVGSLISTFLFHVYAWGMGRFNSFGLLRVMLAIAPCAALIGAYCGEFLYSKFTIRKSIHLNLIFLVLIIIIDGFIFRTVTHKTFYKKPIQIAMDLTTDYVRREYPQISKTHLLSSAAYLPYSLNIDPFGPYFENLRAIHETNRKFPKGSLLIWDSHYSIYESQISLEQIKNDSRFLEIRSFSFGENPEHRLVLFETKDGYTVDYADSLTMAQFNKIEQDILRNAEYMDKILIQSIYHNIGLDSCIRLNARYILERLE
ncbi:MAG: hypothetical protein IPM48_12275 [Saprospiraceae bacterium]|nr:hypothetical protein [Saprospiraceae bacterium]